MNKPRAVLFDYDGVIADTMDDNYLAWKKTCQDYNIDIKRNDYLPLEGYSTKRIAQIILRKCKRNINPQSIVDLKHYYYYLRHNRLRLYFGIKKILNYLKQKKVLVCLVTGADRRRLKSSIPLLIDKFDVAIAGDDNIKGKLAPGCY